MVEVVRYQPSMLPSLKLMLRSQSYLGMADVTNETLPEIGFVAIQWVSDDCGIPTAAGFLRRVEGGFAQMDTLMSNAQQSSELRHEAISKCVDKLIIEAKNLNLYGVLATSSDNSTIMRALSMGFHLVENQKLIALPLREPITHV